MSDDKLLRALGHVAAEEKRSTEPKWEKLVHGELSNEEIAELEKLAAVDEEAEALLVTHRPIDEEGRQRIVDALAANLAPAENLASPVNVAPPVRPVGDLASRREKRVGWQRRIAPAAAIVALAAGVVLFLKREGEPELSLYTLNVSGTSTARGPESAEQRGPCVLSSSQPGSFELLARAETAIGGPISARAFLVKGVETVPWEGSVEVSPSGSVRILDATTNLVGARELVLVVARKEVVSDVEASKLAHGTASSGRGWQVLRCLVDPAPSK